MTGRPHRNQPRVPTGVQRIDRKVRLAPEVAKVIDREVRLDGRGFPAFVVDAVLTRCDQLRVERIDGERPIPATINAFTTERLTEVASQQGLTVEAFIQRWIDLDRVLLWLAAWAEGDATAPHLGDFVRQHHDAR